MAPGVKRRFKNRVMMTVIGGLAALAITTSSAIANDHHSRTAFVPQSSAAHLDISARAVTDARQNRALALIIAHGPVTADPNDEFTDPYEYSAGLKSWLAQGPIDLITHYIATRGMGPNEMSMTFTNGYTSQGPMGPNKVPEQINDIVREFHRFNKLMSEK